MAKTNSNNGCIVLIGFIGLIVLIANMCSGDNETKIDTQETSINEKLSHSAYKQQSTITHSVKDELSDEDKTYLDNSLPTGSTPYSKYYGRNYKCPYDQCSSIRVTAPQESDIIVIIKHNNQNGKVVAHGYIRSGATYQFDIPDGVYQTFFYYGEGWNPNKAMKGGIKGGFVKDELFSKDNPQEIYSGILTYVLQLQRNGNFQTRGSSPNEVF